MSLPELSRKSETLVLRKLSHSFPATSTNLDRLIRQGKVPKNLKWQPSLCIERGKETILVHILVSQDFPAYLESAIEGLRKGGFERLSMNQSAH